MKHAFAPNPQVLGAGSLSELQLGLFLARKKGNVLLSSHARAGMQSGSSPSNFSRLPLKGPPCTLQLSQPPLPLADVAQAALVPARITTGPNRPTRPNNNGLATPAPGDRLFHVAVRHPDPAAGGELHMAQPLRHPGHRVVHADPHMERRRLEPLKLRGRQYMLCRRFRRPTLSDTASTHVTIATNFKAIPSRRTLRRSSRHPVG